MDIVAALRSRAEMSAKAMQLMAQSKSERNQAAGDAGASYGGGTREQTVEWKAADEIERLRRVNSDLLSYLNGISRQAAEMVKANR